MPKSKIVPIKADDFADFNVSNVLGTYEGECADANVTNKNGLDITRPVWETVFNSEEYKQAIELGWYIGFLGHPEDPNCMDFRNACIVMRSGRIDDNGKIYGKFDLIDTPVGRVVKAFQDAGVVFGISVRGAGDIVDNSVDPETFVFRGFDLVTFPAYGDAIPTFTKIAASTDMDSRQKYQRVCAAINANVKDIDSEASLELIQSQLAAQSDEYALVEARKQELCQSSDEVKEDLTEDRVAAMTHLYLQQVAANTQLRRQLDVQAKQSARRTNRIRAIMSAQMKEATDDLTRVDRKYRTAVAANSKLKTENISLQTANLKYKQDIQSSRKTVQSKDSELSALRHKLAETVGDLKDERAKTSNLGAEASSLRKQLVAANTQLADFQQAYALIYANAVGVEVDSIPINASTSVSDIRELISGASSINRVSSPALAEGDFISDVGDDPDDLVTL
jgi:hypothetical protein